MDLPRYKTAPRDGSRDWAHLSPSRKRTRAKMTGQTEQSQATANDDSPRANPQLTASKVETTADKRFIILHIQQSTSATPAQVDQLKYPLVWLRDNCQCDECFNPKMQSRTITWTNFDINCAPKQLASHAALVQGAAHAEEIRSERCLWHGRR